LSHETIYDPEEAVPTEEPGFGSDFLSGEADPWGVFGINSQLAGIQIGGAPDRTVGRAIAQFWTMTPEEIRDLQGRLYGGGFYPSTYYARGRRRPTNFITEGVPDEVTFSAYQDALLRAARRKLAEQLMGRLAAEEMGLLEAVRRQPIDLEEEPPELQG
jgi:hypothetical protein